MPTFIDGHSMKGLDHAKLEMAVNSHVDKFGVSHLEVFYNEDEDRLYCILNAPNEEAVWKHHEALGLKCEFVTSVQQIKTKKTIMDEKLQILGGLAAQLSHDLRNPISIIKNAVDLMSIKYKDKLNADIFGQFAKIDRAVIRMNMLISDVLNYSRTQSLILDKWSISDVIKRSLEGIVIPDNIKLNISKNDFTFKCDGTKLQVVFYNLITNAIQSIGEKNPGEIVVRCNKLDGMFQIEVQNSGPQIPDDVLPKIFEPLFTTKEHGTGLGLPSCKNIIEQHHGTISVKNNPTTFTILLPKDVERLLSVSN